MSTVHAYQVVRTCACARTHLHQIYWAS